jgi:hypothetical protein
MRESYMVQALSGFELEQLMCVWLYEPWGGERDQGKSYWFPMSHISCMGRVGALRNHILGIFGLGSMGYHVLYTA